MDDAEQDMVDNYEHNIKAMQDELSEKNILFQGL